jgi:UDP-N-acetylglucosamine--N-acetylmuramyl-(pentapeptide) pyrophosphoryl-undecaprenol N-acetylglucosamine transferase
MRLLLCGGGTAGHVNPAIAIAEEIRSRDNSASFLCIGREGGRENELINKAGFEVKTIKIEGLRRSLSSDNIRRIICALKAKSAAEKIIKDFNPDFVFGTGGYVCWPVITAAKSLGIKTAIHESNVSPGITTKMVSGKCDIIFLNHEKTNDYLGRRKNSLVVGNPLRQDFGRLTRDEARRKLKIKDSEFFILSFGGSIGAQRLNEVMLEVIEKYSSKNPRVKHLHAMGKRYYREGEKKYVDRAISGCRIVAPHFCRRMSSVPTF